MIPKGNQRGGGQQLATHLLNAYDNDRVEVAEVRGAIAQDLHGAFAEWYAQAMGTKCKKYLYSLSINPDHRQGPFSREHYDDFIRRTEERLGLTGQPRAVVFHVKYGREHCHVVWSRIDTEKMRAVQLSHDRQELRSIAQEYARDYGLTLPDGMRNNRGKDRFNQAAKGENYAEKQQQERSGITKQQRIEQITKLWRDASDGRSFVKALAANGYYLARGDQRAYVVVDLYGEIHSLSRQLPGVKPKHLKARLADYVLDKLPAAAAAQEHARQQLASRLQQEKTKDQAPAKAPEDTPDRRQARLTAQQQERRALLTARRVALARQHLTERDALKQLQDAENKGVLNERLARQPKGIAAFLTRITGIQALVAMRQNKQDRERAGEHRRQTEALARRHRREMENFAHHERALTRVEKRENRSLRTNLRREEFRAIAAPTRQQQPRARLQDIRRTAGQLTRPPERGQAPGSLAPDFNEAAATGRTKPGRSILSPTFNEAARTEGTAARGGLAAKFNEAAEKLAPANAGDQHLEQIKGNAADVTTPPGAILPDLAKAFRERAAQKRKQRDGMDRDDTRGEKHYRNPPQDFTIRR